MAQQEGLEEKHKVLLNGILGAMESDTNWDPNVPREKAFLDAGEKRYFYQKKQLTETGQVMPESDKVSAGGELKKGSADKFLLNAPSSSSAEVKVENPALLKFKQALTVVRSGKSSLEKLLLKSQDLLPGLLDQKPGAAADLGKANTNCSKEIEELRKLIHAGEKNENPQPKDQKALDAAIGPWRLCAKACPT